MCTFLEASAEYTIDLSFAGGVDTSGQCANDSCESIGKWHDNNLHFMRTIMLNSSTFNCPNWNARTYLVDEGDNPRRISDYVAFNNLFVISNVVTSVSSFSLPNNESGSCKVESNRGLTERNSSHVPWYQMPTMLLFDRETLRTTGSLLWLLPFDDGNLIRWRLRAV